MAYWQVFRVAESKFFVSDPESGRILRYGQFLAKNKKLFPIRFLNLEQGMNSFWRQNHILRKMSNRFHYNNTYFELKLTRLKYQKSKMVRTILFSRYLYTFLVSFD